MKDNLPQSLVSSLSGREREVLLLVADGYRTKEIATRLGLAPGTVENQILAARHKLGGLSRAEAGRLVRDATDGQFSHGQKVHIPGPGPDAASDAPDQSAPAQSPGQVREERAAFEHAATGTFNVPQPQRGNDHVQHGLTTIKLIESIAIRLIIILASTPVLIWLFKRLRDWILSFYSR